MSQLSPYYNPGAIIDLGDQAFQVESVLREGKGIMQALKVRRVTKKTKTKNMADEDHALVLKIFRTKNQCAVANRAFEYWKRLQEVLRPSGFPDIHHCDSQVVVTDFIEGIVAEKIDKLNSKIISKIVLDIAEQIDVLLRHDMAHGDIKPANIVRKAANQGAPRSKLIDLDYLAPFGNIEIGNPPVRFGTPDFMPPEHIEGKYQCGTDMYALGKSALRLIGRGYQIDTKQIFAQYGLIDFLTRESEPEQRKFAERHLFRSLARRDGENERQSQRLINFIMKSTSFHAEQRPQSAEEVRQMLAA